MNTQESRITLAAFAKRGAWDQADDCVIKVLGHVAFMAFLAEVRDQNEARCMRNYAWSSRTMMSPSDRHALLAGCGDIYARPI